MTPDGGDEERPLVRWNEGDSPVRLSETGDFAYLDGQVIVHEDGLDAARTELGRDGEDRRAGVGDVFGVFLAVDESLLRIEALRARGIYAQPNHVLFNTCGCYCPPHPSLAQHWAAVALGSNPLGSNPLGSNPLGSNPLGSNPLGSNPLGSNPLGSNPYGWAPSSDYAPWLADLQPNPGAVPSSLSHPFDGREFRSTGGRGHSVHPAMAPVGAMPGLRADERARPNIVVLDTGLAAGDLLPNALNGVVGLGSEADWVEKPDEDGDERLDPVAGHGTFIAGVIERIAPRCRLKVDGLFPGFGQADEVKVSDKLQELARMGEAYPEDHVDILNLSFSGYTLHGMAPLAQAVIQLQLAGTVVVASAGNDGTCVPAYPAAFPGVISVGAIGPSGPAWFTNYGPWVRACAPGVDIVSTFFTEWKRDKDEEFTGWARWSGTSFAAPAVVGALAAAMQRRPGMTPKEAVAEVIDDPTLMRIPGLGTVVNQGQGWPSPP
jgi:subtilisin family serine protease